MTFIVGEECIKCKHTDCVEVNVINLSCSPAQGKPPEAASRHGRRAMTRPLPLNQAV